MTMLEILEARLPEGLSIVECKEKSNKFIVEFEYDGSRERTELPKTCAPGKENDVCDFSIQLAMTSIMLDKGDLNGIKAWKDYAANTKRRGRPKAEKPKGIKYSIRIDEETESRLENYCVNKGVSKGEAFRKGIELLLEQAET